MHDQADVRVDTVMKQTLKVLLVCDVLSTELSSPRSVTSSRSSYGLPSPFGSTPYPAVKPASSVDNLSPSSSSSSSLSLAAAAVTCPPAASQPLVSPLSTSTARDDCSTFPAKQLTADRQVLVDCLSVSTGSLILMLSCLSPPLLCSL